MGNKPEINILLVDDKPHNLITLEETLKGLGYHFVKAQSGREALRHIMEHDFAVILLDVNLPDIDGFELARIIRSRERTQAIPILFVTAYSSDEVNIFKGYSVGA